MKFGFKSLFLILIAAVVLGMILQSHSGGKEIVHWRNDLAAAREEARTANKSVFVEFSASWCGPCQEMGRTTWSDKTVAAELDKMVPVKIDVDSHPEIAREYGINPIPSYIILDSKGDAIKSGVGYRGPDEFIAWLNEKPDGP